MTFAGAIIVGGCSRMKSAATFRSRLMRTFARPLILSPGISCRVVLLIIRMGTRKWSTRSTLFTSFTLAINDCAGGKVCAPLTRARLQVGSVVTTAANETSSPASKRSGPLVSENSRNPRVAAPMRRAAIISIEALFPAEIKSAVQSMTSAHHGSGRNPTSAAPSQIAPPRIKSWLVRGERVMKSPQMSPCPCRTLFVNRQYFEILRALFGK